MIDQTAFFSLSYGLYVISSKDADRAAGCVANTFQQVTSSPMQVSVALNKGNATTGVIRSAGRFSATCLAQDAPKMCIRDSVGPVRAQTVVADDQVLGNVPYQVVVELPRRVVAVRAGEAYSVVAGVVRAAVFLGASHGRTVPLSRAEPPDGRLLRGRSRRPCPYLQ